VNGQFDDIDGQRRRKFILADVLLAKQIAGRPPKQNIEQISEQTSEQNILK
jgi:hypothetical protein